MKRDPATAAKVKRPAALILALSILLSGCAFSLQPAEQPYTATFFGLFDTVTTVTGFAGTQEQFQQQAQQIRDALHTYHQLFDIYAQYDGISNLKTVNDRAGQESVRVDRAIIELLQDCKRYYGLTGGKVNVAMGSVLRLWHEARSAGIQDPAAARLPDADALRQAAEHCSMDALVIDEAASTVYLSDPAASLDVGAVAKGWACQRVAQNAPSGLLISVGGNVCATGPKKEDGTPWVIGIQHPDGGAYLHTVCVTGGAVVTSGDYQRFYTVEGTQYHHIIDPDTRMPAAYWRSVSIVCSDSGLADALSTALFLLPLEEGQALARQCGAEALWLDGDGNEYMTPGFRAMLQA